MASLDGIIAPHAEEVLVAEDLAAKGLLLQVPMQQPFPAAEMLQAMREAAEVRGTRWGVYMGKFSKQSLTWKCPPTSVPLPTLHVLQAAPPSDRAPLQAMLNPLQSLARRHLGGKEGFARKVPVR